jgi:hypothetical protein
VIDGIMGLSYRGSSSVHAVPVFEALVKAGLVKNIFSFCINQNGGVLTLVCFTLSLSHFLTLFHFVSFVSEL